MNCVQRRADVWFCVFYGLGKFDERALYQDGLTARRYSRYSYVSG